MQERKVKVSEKIIVRQNKAYETEIRAYNPEDFEEDDHDHGEAANTASSDAVSDEDYVLVHSVYELTPYTMMLVSLATCTAILLTSYAENHEIDLTEVELRLEYQRNFKEDCKNCEEIDQYEEQIVESIQYRGNLSEQDRRRLQAISRRCPIHMIMEQGISIQSSHAFEPAN